MLHIWLQKKRGSFFCEKHKGILNCFPEQNNIKHLFLSIFHNDLACENNSKR